MSKSSGAFIKVYEIVKSIPAGRVLTYGLISNLMEGRLSAQGVGWALKALPAAAASKQGKTPCKAFSSATVPWHRVINSQGTVSTHKIDTELSLLQRQLLEREGIVFDENGRVDLGQYLWTEGLMTIAGSD